MLARCARGAKYEALGIITAVDKQRIVVGLSGGVDSAVSAWLLARAGHEVIGLFMKNWEGDDDGAYCSSNADFVDAAAVADVIGIELEHVNFAAEYRERVFAEFLREYRAARTPNPDVLCNAEIKFKAFLDHAMRLGAEKIATGHYARVRETAAGVDLLKGLDPAKDQSYFLHRLTQAQLALDVSNLADKRPPVFYTSGSGGKLAIFDMATSSVTTAFLENWGQSSWLDGWIDDNDVQLAGDFLGLGRAQVLFVNRSGTGGRVMIADLASGRSVIKYQLNWGEQSPLDGWLDANDFIANGDFLGVGHDQLLLINRTPGLADKLQLIDFSSGRAVVEYLESWSSRTLFDGVLLGNAILRCGDFAGSGRAQLLCADPNAPDGPVAIPPALPPTVRALGHISNVGDVNFTTDSVRGVLIGRDGQNLEGIQLSIDPALSGVTIEYMASLFGTGDTAWVPSGTFCGTRGQSRSIDGVAIRLSGPQASRYRLRYASNLGTGKDGSFCGARGKGKPMTFLRLFLEPNPV